MEANKKRIRKDFAPLNIVSNLICSTPNSPVMQVYNALNGEWEPDRYVSPTAIFPVVNAAATDGSWTNGPANNLLANMVWKVDGVDISTIPAWVGKYTIETSGNNRGQLTITRNLYPSERFRLSFEAVIPDNRFGINVPVKADGISLSTSDKSVDDYSLSISEDQIIKYNPFKDRLLIYEYKVAKGLVAYSDAERLAAIDYNAYERSINVTVNKGPSIITTGFTLKLYKISGSTLTEVGTSDYEVLSLTNSLVKLDLRLIEKADYMLKVFVLSKEMAHKQFSVGRAYPKIIGDVASGSSINPGEISHCNKALISCDGDIVRYPEAMLSILWKTETYDAANGTKTVVHNEGEQALVNLKNAGVGDTEIDDWMNIFFEATQKGAMNIASDESGNTLINESGNILII